MIQIPPKALLVFLTLRMIAGCTGTAVITAYIGMGLEKLLPMELAWIIAGMFVAYMLALMFYYYLRELKALRGRL